MAKKSRNIKVDNAEYCWTVKSKNVDLLHIGIWQKIATGQKLNIKLKFDDPWLNYGPIITCNDPGRIRDVLELRPITPTIIKSLIDAALEFGWEPSLKGAELYLVWDRKLEFFKQISAEEYKSLITFY